MSSQSRKARTAYFNRMQCDQIKSRKQNPANDERKNSRESDSDNTTDRRGVSKFLSRHLYNATIMVAGNGAAKSRSTFLIMFHSLMLISPSVRPPPLLLQANRFSSSSLACSQRVCISFIGMLADAFS